MMRLKTWGIGLSIAVLAGCGSGGAEVSVYEGMTEEEIAQTKQMEEQVFQQQRAMINMQQQQLKNLNPQAAPPALPALQPAEPPSQ